ncbi:uncharacterized protein LOC122512344 [Leptopilina heterotoma]|uniref:uncharacterized protein LOC122512344 n=1 Tax=Leptopilina heterotoma TaxID=63436 RepID=UPI001CA993D3|nr:uncharacterized protein LOC122512344 [Leptopilina heterotoma]
MIYRSKFLVAFNLILLVLLGQISILRGSNVEEKERTSMPDNDICTLFDYSRAIDRLLFRKNYKPLIVLIASEFIEGINRVRNISHSKRISYDKIIKNNNYWSMMYNIISENFYLFQADHVYYFIYPVNILHYSFTIYCQKMLLSDQVGVTFDFVNVKQEYPFYEDILVPLKPSCTNCLLVEYVNKKLQAGESFSELFQLREQLFGEKTKYISLEAFDNDYVCDSIGFNINSESESFIMHFNTLLQQIKKNNNFDESYKKNVSDRSLKCFNSRLLIVRHDMFYDNIEQPNEKHPFTGINYLNWINETVFSLNANDTSFGNICKNEHNINTFKLFCFIKDVSDITSYNISAWTDTLQQHVNKSLVKPMVWFNSLMSLYQNEYLVEKDFILHQLENLKKQTLNESGNWRNAMRKAYNLVSNLTREENSIKSMLSSPCLFYNYLDTINALLPEMNFKKLVIIVTNNMQTGIWKAGFIRGKRVIPKINREDLHYKKQFVYDEIMKHFYLFQSNGTYYYVYPLNFNRHHDVLITYFEYKMIEDYSKVVFYFVNIANYFSLDEVNNIRPDSVISALPDNCHLFTTNCRNRFLKPIYLITLHQEFHRRYPKYFSVYATFFNSFAELINNPHSHYEGNNTIEYAQKFYDFLKGQQISYDTEYLFNDIPCLSLQIINKKINIDISITELGNFFNISTLIQSAYKNITSINITDNDNLKYFCMHSNIFQFIKFFCFLKINYIEGMLKLIDTTWNYVENMTKIAENEKNVITEYLSKTLKWMNATLSIDYSEMYQNEGRILRQSKLSYSEIPKIISNGDDLLDKFYLVIREAVVYYRCKNYTKRNSSQLNQELSAQVLDTTNISEEVSSCLIK